MSNTGAYVAGPDYSIADIACFPWTMTHKAQGFTLDDYPNVKRWYAVVRARPQVQAGLAIGKFVKEPFDEEARKNMFGPEGEGDGGEKMTAPSNVIARSTTCDGKQSPELSPFPDLRESWIAFAALAMTIKPGI